MMAIRRTGGAVIVYFCLILSVSYGCGISWIVPTTHFPGVDEKGHVCYSEKIAELDLGDDLKLPLIINFRSDREKLSPYVGKGWILALFDSNFVQVAENTFAMTQPDGWVRTFYRAKRGETILDGGPAWKAEINGDSISAAAGCGWKISYTKGKITRIDTPKSRHIEFVYSDGVVSELRENGAVKCQIEFDRQTRQAQALVFNNQRIKIEFGEKPRVEKIAGNVVVSGIDSALHRFTGPNASSNQFEFAVDNQVIPTIKIVGPAPLLMKWDPVTRRIVADNDWKYIFTEAEPNRQEVGMERVNASGRREVYNFNAQAGKTEETDDLGRLITTQRFASGVLAGRIRKIEIKAPGGESQIYKNSYDELGNKIGESFPDGTDILYQDIRRTLKTAGGAALPEKAMRATTVTDSAGGKKTFWVDTDGRISKITYEAAKLAK